MTIKINKHNNYLKHNSKQGIRDGDQIKLTKLMEINHKKI
jgi:hypothetical protein